MFQTREERRLRHKEAQRQLRLPPGELKPIDLSTVYPRVIPLGMTRAFRNNRYTVMIYENEPTTKGPATRVMVERHDEKPIPGHWAEMQKIKNFIFGPEAMAIEYYPKESQLINSKNIYWFWVFPEGVLPVPVLY